MAVIDKILRKSNFTAAMNALVTALNGIFVRKEDGKGLSAMISQLKKRKSWQVLPKGQITTAFLRPLIPLWAVSRLVKMSRLPKGSFR